MTGAKIRAALAAILSLALLAGCGAVRQAPDAVLQETAPVRQEPAAVPEAAQQAPQQEEQACGGVSWNGIPIPEWDGTSAYTDLNGGVPFFDEADLARTDAFEIYSDLDGLGRCGPAYANICIELMPTEDRGEIGNVRPSGWHTVRYNDLVAGNYLYNRCHLIGFQLAGENANEKNLITGTRYLNIDGMLDLENAVADHVRGAGGHVLYRATPVFAGDELVARGVLLEAWSVEDAGAAVSACRYCYNVQPGIGIDYLTGGSRRLDGRNQNEIEKEMDEGPAMDFVLNTNSGKFHLPDCRYVAAISEDNRLELHESLSKMLQAGYGPCGSCHPDQ